MKRVYSSKQKWARSCINFPENLIYPVKMCHCAYQCSLNSNFKIRENFIKALRVNQKLVEHIEVCHQSSLGGTMSNFMIILY